MYFQRINAGDPEKMFILAKNSAATALSNGQSVVWDWTTDVDGVGVQDGFGTENVSCGIDFAGIAVESIAVGAYGLLQTYGYHAAVRVRTMTSTGHVYHESRAAIAKGTPLVAGITASVFCMEGITPAETAQVLHPGAFAMEAQASFTTKTIKAFIKAM
jgi:hypothetical protein